MLIGQNNMQKTILSIEEIDLAIDGAWECEDMRTVFESGDSTCITFIDGSMLQYWASGKVILHPADLSANLITLESGDYFSSKFS